MAEYSRRKLAWPIWVGMIGGLGLLWFVSPFVISRFYQATGYKSLTQALEILGDENTEPDFCVAGGIEHVQARELVEEAVAALEVARKFRPSEAQSWLLLGRGYCLLGQMAEAVAAYDRFTGLRPGNPLGWLELGFAYEEEKNFEKVLASWATIHLSHSTFLEAGENMRIRGKVMQAVTLFTIATEYFPQTADAYYYLGLTFQNNQQWALALEAYDSALAHGVFQSVQVGDIYYQKGLIFQTVPEFTDLPQALNMYDTALDTGAFSSDFIYANVHYKRGEIFLWKGEPLNKAISDFEAAIALDSSHYLAHLRLGHVLYQVSKDLDAAEKEILTAITLWPNLSQKGWPYRVLSAIYEDAGFTEKALVMVQEALILDPQDTQSQIAVERLLAEMQKQP